MPLPSLVLENEFGEKSVNTVLPGTTAFDLSLILLTGLVPGANTPILATDDVLTALANLQAQIDAGGGGGVPGFTSPDTGIFNMEADPDTGLSTLIMGAENYDGTVKTADAETVGGYAGDLNLQGGNTDSGHAGKVVISAGYKTDTNEQAEVLVQGGRIKFDGVARLFSYTQTQIDAMSPQTGDMIINSTIPALQVYYDGAWKTVTAI